MSYVMSLCHMSYMSLSCHVSCVICHSHLSYLSYVFCRICHMSYVICHCHMSYVICVICHMSYVICHMSHVICQTDVICHIPKAMPTQNEVAAAKQRVISALEAHARQSLEAQQATGFASSSLPFPAKSPPSF